MKKSIVKKADGIMKFVNPKNAGLSLVKELKEMKNVEDLGTAIYQSSEQFYLLIQSILQEKYGFSDTHLKELNEEVRKAVEGLAWFEDKGLNPLSVKSVAQLTDVTMNHYQTLKAAKAGLELPTSKEALKILMGKKKK